MISAVRVTVLIAFVWIHKAHVSQRDCALLRLTLNISLYSLRPAEPHVLTYARQNPTITLHRDLRQSSANARSHMLVPHRGTLFLQTYVQFLTVVVLNQN